MHHQASFIPSFFPEGTVLGAGRRLLLHAGLRRQADLGKPVLGAGTLVAHHQGHAGGARLHRLPEDADRARDLDGAVELPHPVQGREHDAYANDQMKKQGEILLNATTFRFDGSDLMPGTIGAGAFWTGMVDFVGGKYAATWRPRSRRPGTRSSRRSPLTQIWPGPLAARVMANPANGCQADGKTPSGQKDRRQNGADPGGGRWSSSSSARFIAIVVGVAACALYYFCLQLAARLIFCRSAKAPQAVAQPEARRDDPAVALPLPGAAVPRRLSGLPGVRVAPAQLLRPVRPELRRLQQLRLGGQRRRVPAVDPQQPPLAARRAGDRDLLRAGHRRPRRPDLVGQYRQVADLHADGDLLRRRVRDLEVRLRLPRRGLDADRPAQRDRPGPSAASRRRGSRSRSGTTSS